MCPTLIDVQIDEDFAADPRLLPGTATSAFASVAEWAPRLRQICRGDLPKRSQAQRRCRSMASAPRRFSRESRRRRNRPGQAKACRWSPQKRFPPRDERGRTIWVTRSRPKVDRIACPWLIRRFVDPLAVFLFVPHRRRNGRRRTLQRNTLRHRWTDVFWSHRGELCTFDVMVEEFGLATKPLAAARTHRARRRHRASRSRAGGGRFARGVARVVAHVCG